jgi:ribonuclease BN (tRNA processing enzyme)
MQAADAGVGQLVLVHLQPGTDIDTAVAAARTRFAGPTAVAVPDLVVDLD